MFALVRKNSVHATGRRSGSSMALAIALVSSAALGGMMFETPAYAAKKDKAESKSAYSKEFMAAYKPVEELSKAATPDTAALTAGAESLIAAVTTPDDNWAGGSLVYNIGVTTKDVGLQRRGMDMMIGSGKIPEGKEGSYLSTAGQLAFNDEDYSTARTRFEEAIASGNTNSNLEAVIAESYFREDRFAEGLAYLRGVINKMTSEGVKVQEDWIKRGVSVAYNNGLAEEAVKYGLIYAKNYPSQTSWGDSIAIQRNLIDYDEASMLDLMRLAYRTDSLRSGRDYADYIEAADARKLPGEVQVIVNQGIDRGQLEKSDPFVKEVKSIADERIAADKKELPDLEKDARAPGSTALTATAAGDAFLSYGMAAKAEEMYTSALTKPNVDTPRVLTRLAIAQTDAGKFDEARANFAKVDGIRQPIARLWMVYVGQKAAAAAPANDTAEAAETEPMAN